MPWLTNWRLGRVFEEILKFIEKEVKPDSIHLIKSLIEELPPPCEAVLYHPFFWFEDEMAVFLQLADTFRDKNNIFWFKHNVELNESFQSSEFLNSTQQNQNQEKARQSTIEMWNLRLPKLS